ncbi:ATP-binding protein [Hydrogenophaga sp. A37]|uniref:ATP-binding protein n=1 Tax=Hydrogenophaga sp. A37 TaxID=1945864 RepID=UPI0009846F2A|nr:ATP-binding protein [Hydrogenophaga sp. A37]
MAGKKSNSQNQVDASPTKRFFVEMLTRDIELDDAILDLLDNCLDGAVRTNENKPPRNPAKPYAGYWAEITLDAEHFCIKDNCGGIPLDIAKEYAFRFGRKDNKRDKDLHTVGVYGIGMKRAIFKMGADCWVRSHHADGSFGVHIDQNWISGDDKWELEMDRNASVPSSQGVSVEITDLLPNIQTQFHPNKGGFAEVIKKKIRLHYAYIIKKGFTVKVNGTKVEPNDFQTLIANDLTQESAIAPYVYETEADGVKVQLILGMYERFPSQGELDDYEEGKRAKDTAGWTVICNDRVVVANDTSHLTGWGESGVPSYHSQYVMLSGIVEFISKDASLLPVTTTKRGVDLNSALYADVKNIMRDALKHFTSFTNNWKTQTDERASMQTQTRAIDIRDAVRSVPAAKWQDVRKGMKGKRFIPELPRPIEEKTHARISFSRHKDEVQLVANLLCDPGTNPKPSEVGETAFEWALKEAKE